MRSNLTIRTNDGKRIWISCREPRKSNARVLVIAPGIGLTHEYYRLFGCYFCLRGYTVITFDYRGMGKSIPPGPGGIDANMHQWAVQDINAVLLYAKQYYPNQEIIYTGHGVGGEIIGLVPASQYINRIILVNSALSCAKGKNKIRFSLLKLLARLLNPFFGYFPGRRLGIFGDLPPGVIREWANWCDNANGLFDNFPDNNYRKLGVPLLACTFPGEWHCPPGAVKELLKHFVSATITWYPLRPKEVGIKKTGRVEFFSPAMRSTVWGSLVQWLNKDDQLQHKKIS